MSWELTTLGEYYDVRDGTHDSPKYVREGYPLVTSKNLKGGKINLEKVKFISKEDYLNISKRSRVDVGDVLMAMIGTIGNPVEIVQTPEFAIKNVALFKTDKHQSAAYLKYFLSSPDTKNKMLADAKGATQKFVGLGYLRSFPIKVPPLPVQKQIVEKLDAAFVDIDKAISTTEKNIENAETLFSKTLNKTLEDNLSKEFLLGELCEVITKGTTPTSVGHKFTDEGINFIKIESIANQGNFLPEKMAHIDEECHESLKRSQLAPGDILFSIAGALGRTAIVTDDIVPANTNQALAIIRLKKHLNINKDYLRYVLNSNLTINQSDSLKAGVAQQNLSLSQLKTYKINIPSAPIQNDIVKKIDLIKEQTNALIECYQNKFIQYESLKSSILNQAFSGELTKNAA